MTDDFLSKTTRKDSSSSKLPYPVLSDHRDLSSILNSLQKETQTTSKKISEVIEHIDECERRLISPLVNDTQKKSSKSECVKFKQQLDALKKHERRVSLQIDFITTKNEIKSLDDERQSNGNEQIEILLRKLNQKLEKMKIYMRTRNEQMKKQISLHDKRRSMLQSDANKRFKSNPSVIRLTSRMTNDDSKKHLVQSSTTTPPSASLLIETKISKSNVRGSVFRRHRSSY